MIGQASPSTLEDCSSSLLCLALACLASLRSARPCLARLSSLLLRLQATWQAGKQVCNKPLGRLTRVRLSLSSVCVFLAANLRRASLGLFAGRRLAARRESASRSLRRKWPGALSCRAPLADCATADRYNYQLAARHGGGGGGDKTTSAPDKLAPKRQLLAIARRPAGERASSWLVASL